MSTIGTLMLRPVGGMPMNSPSCVPSKRLWAATRSPSAIVRSTWMRMSGKAASNMAKNCRTPSLSGVGAMGSCSIRSSWISSSMIPRLPALTSS